MMYCFIVSDKSEPDEVSSDYSAPNPVYEYLIKPNLVKDGGVEMNCFHYKSNARVSFETSNERDQHRHSMMRCKARSFVKS